MGLVDCETRPPVRLDAGKRNVLTLEAVEALRDALASDPEAPVVVLSGRADGFCAGLDNRTLAAGAKERDGLLAAMGALLYEVLAGPTRIVAVCEGHAVAAGAMLLLVLDIRLGAPGAYKIGFTEPGLGMPLPDLPPRDLTEGALRTLVPPVRLRRAPAVMACAPGAGSGMRGCGRRTRGQQPA